MNLSWKMLIFIIQLLLSFHVLSNIDKLQNNSKLQNNIWFTSQKRIAATIKTNF